MTDLPTPAAPSSPSTVFGLLRKAHPDAHCELDHRTPFELIVATVLSAQSTDVGVNKVTPALFEKWPNARELARAALGDVEAALNRLGMYRQKAKNIVGLAQQLVARHGGEVPRTLAELVELPGVGRKTANVVLGVAFGAPEGVVVDTHVQRLAQRLGWSQQQEPVKIEQDLMAAFPKKHWDLLSHTLIFHGRRICTARSPACASCPVKRQCPSAFHAENIGRKPGRMRATNADEGATSAPLGQKGRSTRAAVAKGAAVAKNAAVAKKSAAAAKRNATAAKQSAVVAKQNAAVTKTAGTRRKAAKRP